MKANRAPEPRQIWVLLESWTGSEVQLMNDGVVTVKEVLDGGDDDQQVLQTRSAFRGFIGAMVELMGYRIKSAWDDRGVEEEGEEY